MTTPPDPDTTGRIIRQGRALVRAIEGLTEIEPTGPIERFVVGLLPALLPGRPADGAQWTDGWCVISLPGAAATVLARC